MLATSRKRTRVEVNLVDSNSEEEEEELGCPTINAVDNRKGRQRAPKENQAGPRLQQQLPPCPELATCALTTAEHGCKHRPRRHRTGA